jgi:two-component system OmpR family response regulator
MIEHIQGDVAPRILIVEDDEDLRGEIAAYLGANGYSILQAEDAVAARSIFGAEGAELILLDVNLPGEDGLSLCRSFAAQDGPPIMVLSALGEPVDRIIGLELGADDYLVKPIAPRELLARIRALLRRRAPGPAATKVDGYRFAGFSLDVDRRFLRTPSGATLLLTRSELTILQVLLASAPAVVRRDELAQLLRGVSDESASRGIDLHISRLRRKIHDQAHAEIIRTHRGVGYRIEVSALPGAFAG